MLELRNTVRIGRVGWFVRLGRTGLEREGTGRDGKGRGGLLDGWVERWERGEMEMRGKRNREKAEGKGGVQGAAD